MTQQPYSQQPQQNYPVPPPPQWYPHWPMQRPEPKNGFGITALVLGIVGLILGLVPLTGWLGVMVAVTGLTLGLVNFGRIHRGVATNKVMTWFGTILSFLALGLSIISMVLFFKAVNDFSNDLEELDREWQQQEWEQP